MKKEDKHRGLWITAGVLFWLFGGLTTLAIWLIAYILHTKKWQQ